MTSKDEIQKDLKYSYAHITYHRIINIEYTLILIILDYYIVHSQIIFFIIQKQLFHISGHIGLYNCSMYNYSMFPTLYIKQFGLYDQFVQLFCVFTIKLNMLAYMITLYLIFVSPLPVAQFDLYDHSIFNYSMFLLCMLHSLTYMTTLYLIILCFSSVCCTV